MFRGTWFGWTISQIASGLATVLFWGSCLGVPADEASTPAVQGLIATAIDSGQDQPYRFDASIYRTETRHLPIGVFDSGIGGLTVLEAILALDAFNNDSLSPRPDGRPDFENERFLYLGDQANMPYGNYAAVGKEAFLRELILKDAVFLLGRRYWSSNVAVEPAFDKPPVKAIVIACNTATAYGLDDLRDAMKAWRIPVLVVGVVEAGARGVAEEIGPSDARRGVAVLATVGTCSSMAYPKAIGKSVGLAGKRVPEIIQQGSIGLAGAIEGDPAFIAVDGQHGDAKRYQGPSTTHPTAPLDWNRSSRYGFESTGLIGSLDRPESLRLNSIANYVRYDILSLLERYRASGGGVPIDTIVLGCTHFPLVQAEIRTAFRQLRDYREEGRQPYRHLIADEIHLVNPAELTAKELFRELAQARLRLAGQEKSSVERDLFFISVPAPNCPQIRMTADGALDPDYKYARVTGQLSTEDTRMVPMSIQHLPESSLALIRKRLPEVWKRIGH